VGAGTAEGFSGFDQLDNGGSSGTSSRRSSLDGMESDDASYDASSRRSSVSSDGGDASDASSGGYTSDASSGGYTSDASGYTSDGYASSDGERSASRPVVCRAHPLHHGAATSDAETVSQLLEAGEDPNGLDKHGCTPLHRAAHSGGLDVVHQILCARADVAAVTEHGHTALHRACMRGHAEVVAELLRAGADHTVATRRGYTALHYAARAGYASSARLLLEASADPDIRDALPDSRNTPMHKACQHGRGEAVYTLLGYNGRPELLNAIRRTPRQVAEDHGEEEAVAVIDAFAHSALLLARSQLLAFAGLLHHRLGTKPQALPVHRVLNADLAQMVGLAYADLQRVCTSHAELDLMPPPIPTVQSDEEVIAGIVGGLPAVAAAVDLGAPPGVPAPEIWAQPEPQLGVDEEEWL
jgi:ankyrin repeat protein